MKVAIINSSFSPHELGGVETYLASTLGELRKVANIVLITGPLDETDRPTSGQQRPGINQVQLGKRYPIWNWASQGLVARAVWHLSDLRDSGVEQQVSRLLSEEAPDVVHTHNVRGLSMSVLGLPSRLGIPHVHTIHDFLLMSPLSNLSLGTLTISPASFPNQVYQMMTRKLAIGVDHVISPSNYLLREHLRMGFFPNSEKHLLRLPSVSKVGNPPLGNVGHHGVDGNNHRPWFLFVGAMERAKGVLTLLDSIRRIPGVEATFHFVGDGRLRAHVEEASARDERIRVHGRIQRNELYSLFTSCDFLLFPSIWPENAPMVLSEALSFDLPVIATDVGGVGELLGPDHVALVHPGSSKALARVIQDVARVPFVRKKSPGGSARVLPSLEDHVRRLVQIYDLASSNRTHD